MEGEEELAIELDRLLGIELGLDVQCQLISMVITHDLIH